jgi:hypothetical protein
MLEQQQLPLAFPLAGDERRNILDNHKGRTHNHHSQQRKLSTCSPIALDLACIEQCPIATNVKDLYIGMMLREVFGDQEVAVATGRVLLATQNNRGLFNSVSQQVLDTLDEPAPLHHLGIIRPGPGPGALLWQHPTRIARRIGRAAAQLLPQEDVLDPLTLQCISQVPLGELGMKAARRNGAHVHNNLNGVELE